jgi:predicted P-loop ATPase
LTAAFFITGKAKGLPLKTAALLSGGPFRMFTQNLGDWESKASELSSIEFREYTAIAGKPMKRTNNLTAGDLEMFERLRIDPELLALAGVKRVTDREARDEFGFTGSGDNSGLLFPYLDATGARHTARLRRDRPEFENGKQMRKYLAPYGDRRHLYTVPGDHHLGRDLTVPVVIVEAEKSALALRACANRTGRQLLPIATGGCWGWRGRIGKTENAKGERVEEVGPLPELSICRDHRKVYVLLDANCNSNTSVHVARTALVRQLLEQNADVHVLDLPSFEGVNGPDDYIGVFGDDAMTRLLDSPPSKIASWRDLLIYRPTKSRSPQPERLLANALIALRHAPAWDGVLGFNSFSQRVVTLSRTPWGTSAGILWSDVDDSLATEWLQQEGSIFVASTVVAEAVRTVAQEHQFHPVRTYLEGLVWDGVPRIGSWLATHLGCQDSEFIRAVGPRWLISAIARVFDPGCQVDCVLLLEGPQGLKKSSALRALVGDEWFTDHIAELGSKDSRLDLLGKWVVEMSELASMRKTETEKVKAFLTARTDHFRLPYDRRATDVPRQNVFAASTNEQQPLVDSTGNRRFWPVACGQIDVERIRRDRDQLWAEALYRFKKGEPWWLETVDLNLLALDEQEQRYEEGVWDGLILDWLENPRPRAPGNSVATLVLPWDGSEPGKVTIPDILIHAIGKDVDRLTQTDRHQVVRCLTHHGWTIRQDRGGPRRGKRFYVKPQL